ncbi:MULTISPECIES: response regulator transcription factor [unclassified Sphingomonas]|uniref:winged helix-turn-helix domain-containing protein n=1 Tax=unclassified Sphingomonas TaxID=196159 RepID=UPI00092A4E0A|nr:MULTISPECIES: response regulator transcription factor [unclassified Sphingomonas]MBN8847873.1 response regulator transcription factor [Sphingomonas sp.]OJV33452.1 MAG: DNA-binding response regulator [Sphingomonas sp. 67-36]
MARILIVEDNPRLAALIAGGLGERGHVCDVAHSLAAADDALGIAAFDGVVLDLGLPDGDGLEWLAHRRSADAPPSLILTARDALEDRVKGLDAGADDYLPKPFAMDELAARLRAMLRRPGARQETALAVGAIRFDAAAHVATAGDVALDLTRRETALLELLLRRAGQVVRRRAIEDALYTFDEAVTPNAIDATVSRLRRKLEEAGASGCLHTIRGVGYLLREGAA